MSFQETVFVLDRAQAPETSNGGATLRATLSPPLQLAPHKRHAVYLDQLSAVNSFNNVSPSLSNDTVALVPVDPSLWIWHATVAQSFTLSYSYVPAQSITVNAGTGTLTELSQAINAELSGGLQLSVVPKAGGNHVWTLRDSGGSDVSAYMTPSSAGLNQLITLFPQPDSGNILTRTIPRGNYGFTEAPIVDAINSLSLPAGEVFQLTLSLDDATNRLKITPAASNTLTLVLGESTLFTSFLGFTADQGWLEAPNASGVVTGLVTVPNLINVNSAQFDAFSTVQVHTPLASSFGPDGNPSTAIAQTLVDVAAGRAFNYHPPRALLVPASPGFSTDTIQVSLRTPSGLFVDTDENWSAVIVVRTFD
jgi:hypothetical protein